MDKKIYIAISQNGSIHKIGSFQECTNFIDTNCTKKIEKTQGETFERYYLNGSICFVIPFGAFRSFKDKSKIYYVVKKLKTRTETMFTGNMQDCFAFIKTCLNNCIDNARDMLVYTTEQYKKEFNK